jgi:diguanylate cyclase (GGDEF)-like protein
MTEYPAIAMQKTGRVSLGLPLHHYAAFGFAFVVMLAHIGLLGWSDIEVRASHSGLMLEALRVGMQTGLQTGLHVAIAVILIVLSSVLPHRGLRYLGVAFVLLVLADSAALLAPVSEPAGATPGWVHPCVQAGGTLGYVLLILLYARREDEQAELPARSPAQWRVSATSCMLAIGLTLIAFLPWVGTADWSGSGMRVALPTLVGAAPIVALAAIVSRRGECVMSIWLVALLAVQALAWSGRYSPGTWGMQLASFSSLAAELAMLIAIMMSTVQHVRTQMRANRHLQVLAHTDSLTGLYNRRYLDDEIEHACQRARRHGTWLSVLMIDIDHFKLFNDTYGHLHGDNCLRRVAAVLQRRQQRCDDAACRYGGEEFALILPACDLDAAHGLAALLCKDVRALGIDHARSARGRVTISIGIAALRITGDARGPDLLRLADDALYAAKRAGRDTVCDMTQIHPPYSPYPQMAVCVR